MACKYSICDVFHWFCKITRFFATEPYSNYGLMAKLKTASLASVYKID